MGCFKSFYGDIVCYCGTEYKHYTPKIEDLRADENYRPRKAPESGGAAYKFFLARAKLAGFDSVEAYSAYLASDAYLEKIASEKHWGRLEVQNKSIGEPDCSTYYPGDKVWDAPIGHLADTGIAVCMNCDERLRDVWIEIKDQTFVGLSLDPPELG